MLPDKNSIKKVTKWMKAKFHYCSKVAPIQSINSEVCDGQTMKESDSIINPFYYLESDLCIILVLRFGLSICVKCQQFRLWDKIKGLAQIKPLSKNDIVLIYRHFHLFPYAKFSFIFLLFSRSMQTCLYVFQHHTFVTLPTSQTSFFLCLLFFWFLFLFVKKFYFDYECLIIH